MNGRSASAAFSFAAIVALSATLKRDSTITGPSPGGGGGGGALVVTSVIGGAFVPFASRFFGLGISSSETAIDPKSTIVACLLSAGSTTTAAGFFFFFGVGSVRSMI